MLVHCALSVNHLCSHLGCCLTRCVHLLFAACALCSPEQPRRCSAAFIHHLCLLLLQVLELFKAADKYDVPGLVKECVQIFRNITHSADVAPLLQVGIAPFSLKHLAVILSVQVVKTNSVPALSLYLPLQASKPWHRQLVITHIQLYSQHCGGCYGYWNFKRNLLCPHHVQVDVNMCLWYIHKRLLWMM